MWRKSWFPPGTGWCPSWTPPRPSCGTARLCRLPETPATPATRFTPRSTRLAASAWRPGRRPASALWKDEGSRVSQRIYPLKKKTKLKRTIEIKQFLFEFQESSHTVDGSPGHDVGTGRLLELRPVSDALPQRRAFRRASCSGRVLTETRGLRVPGPHLLDKGNESADHPGHATDGKKKVNLDKKGCPHWALCIASTKSCFFNLKS